MVDSTPQANVQALRALFAQRNDPVMGVMQVGSRLTSIRNSSYEKNTEEKITKPSVNENSSMKPNVGYPMGKSVSTSSILIAKSNLFTKTNTLPVQQSSASVVSNGSTSESSPVGSSKPKPILGPKPTIAVKPVKSFSSSSVGNSSSGKATNSMCISRSSSSLNSQSTDSIASGNAEEVDEQKNCNNVSETITQSNLQSDNPPVVSFTVKLPYENNTDGIKQSGNNSNASPKSVLKHFDSSSVINSENYICKANLRYRKKLLPPVEKLGNPPLKAPKPFSVVLPTPDMSTFRNKGTAPPLPSRTVPSSVQNSVPELPQRPKRLPPRPPILESNHPVTSQPYPVPAVRRKKLPMLPDSESHSAEEELYEDTIVNENSEPVIPEYTEEQEAEDELYDDTDMQPPPLPSQPPPSRPRYAPPPPPPSGSIGLDNTLGEELYQDAMDNPVEEDLYEEMPADTISNDEANGPMYSNRKEELRFKKEEEKQRRKEQKEKEKKDRELEKLRKKYLITGDELPVDTGVVKCDSRGGRLDLTVKKGEVLEILRMENNPSGKWLVRNDRAKIGYVELTNIQVDANSIKSDSLPSRTKTSTVHPLVDLASERAQTWLAKLTACVR